jgi:hypothetical protein
MFDHIYVLSKRLNRPLRKEERVHHRNGVRDDNHVDNLELWAISQQPPGQRVEDLVKWAVVILSRHRPELLRCRCFRSSRE